MSRVTRRVGLVRSLPTDIDPQKQLSDEELAQMCALRAQGYTMLARIFSTLSEIRMARATDSITGGDAQGDLKSQL